jgi:acid phosphatase type 7
MSTTAFNRRHFLATCSALGGLQSSASAVETIPLDGKLTTSPPALFAPSQTGITVTWAVSSLCLGRVEAGEVDAEGKELPTAPNVRSAAPMGFQAHDEHVLHVRLEGLQAGRNYWYRTVTEVLEGQAKGQREVSVTRHFRLPAAADAEVSFAVWNDTHDAAPTLKRLHELTQEKPPGFLFWNGDVSNNVDREEQLTPLYLAPAGGLPYAATTPCFFSRGNHDVRGLRASRLSHYVAMPGGRPYYSMRYGPLGIIVLDTGEDKPDNHPFFKGMADFQKLREEQAAWLQQEIRQPHLRDAPFRLVLCHIPLRWKDNNHTAEEGPDGYDWVSKRSRLLWHDSLVKWKTQAIISGHTHEWTVLPPDHDFPYLQLIGGGPKPKEAILIRGHANAQHLTLDLIDLQGATVKSLQFPVVA